MTPKQAAAPEHRAVLSPIAPKPFFRVRGLGLSYPGTPAFSGVDLDVRRGAVTAVIGPSGCGKTSFLTCLNRLSDLVPGARVAGSVEIDGQNALDASVDVVGLRRRVGMIFQTPSPFPLSVRRNIELPLREHGARDREIIEGAVESSLRAVGLWDEVKDRLDSPAGALSGGQRQRLCIARALALKPDALLLDEPCGALDPLSSGVVEDLISSLRGRYTVVIVTHNLAQARRIADDCAFFWLRGGAGAIIEHGPVERIFSSPREELTAAYIAGVRG